MSRKITVFIITLILGSGIMLNAQQAGGYTGPGLRAVTVDEARTFRDDTPVVLQGYIIRNLGNERYLFSDDTGTIIIEIDDRLWRNININENDLVEIRGEVDRGFARIEIEADSIRKL